MEGYELGKSRSVKGSVNQNVIKGSTSGVNSS